MNDQASMLPYDILFANRGLTEIETLLHVVGINGGYVAGGYARYCLSPAPKPFQPNDVDVFCKNEGAYQLIVDEIVRRGGAIKFKTDNATTIVPPKEWVACPMIQVINPTVMGGEPWDLISTWDFTVASAALTFGKQGITHLDFVKDELAGRLVINKIQCPIGTMKRVLKYYKKGYKFSSQELLKFYKVWDGLATDRKEELVKVIEIPASNRTEEERETYRRLVYID